MTHRPLIAQLLDSPTLQAAIRDGLTHPSRTAAETTRNALNKIRLLEDEITSLKQRTSELENQQIRFRQDLDITQEPHTPSPSKDHQQPLSPDPMKSTSRIIRKLEDRMTTTQRQHYQPFIDLAIKAASPQEAHDTILRALNHAKHRNWVSEEKLRKQLANTARELLNSF